MIFQMRWFYRYRSFKHSNWWRHTYNIYYRFIIFLCSFCSRNLWKI